MTRQIERIVILALHRQAREVATINDAIAFIEGYTDDGRGKPIERYEIEVRYNNGNAVRGAFNDKESAIDFLRGYQPVLPGAATSWDGVLRLAYIFTRRTRDE